MQQIRHKNSALTVCQRLFIERSLELLYLGSIDSDRVRLHNPRTVFEELKYCLEEYRDGRIKHFQTIKGKSDNRNSIVEEALKLLDQDPNYLKFESISKDYLMLLLKNCSDKDYKKIIPALEILLKENRDYLLFVLSGLTQLVAANSTALGELEKIDFGLNILFSELIHRGFAKGFLYKVVYGIFVNSLVLGQFFDDHLSNFRTRVLMPASVFQIIFRIDTTSMVSSSISAIHTPLFNLSDDVNDISLQGLAGQEMSVFNLRANYRKFVRCNVDAYDYFSALKRARSVLSEYLDVLNLGLSGEFLHIHNRALVIDLRSPERGNFQNNINILDGKYRVERDHYREFTRKVPAILNDSMVHAESKEKIKSAIRYLRLGNQSTEVEHKFLNYWIGLEYLFSNYETQSTINRIKDHLIVSHALAYVKRNTYSFKRAFDKIPRVDQALVPAYTRSNFSCLSDPTFFGQIGDQLLGRHALLAYKAMKFSKVLFSSSQPNGASYVKKHKDNLEAHLTRIYRLRNEIVHDAATDTNNEHIASNLRYYLTFILNELIDYFAVSQTKIVSVEDYFILNEIKFGNIEIGGFLLNQLLAVECSLDFIS